MNKMTNGAYLPPIFGGRLTGTAPARTPPKPSAETVQEALRKKLLDLDSAPRASDLATDQPRRTRGKQRRPVKEQVTLRLDPDVIAHFKGDDPKGWQTRLNIALRQVLREAKRQRTHP